LSWELRLSIALDIALAIQHLHDNGVVHRDLKSDNLLVQNDFRVKLCDFGLARENNAPRMTLVGTPDWLAPEVIMGEGKNIDFV